MAQKIGAVCAFAAVVYVLFGTPLPAVADEPSGDRCRRECQASKEERDAICGGLPTQEARKTCLASSTVLHEKCRQGCSIASLDYTCPRPTWGAECMEKCAESGLACPAGFKHPDRRDLPLGKLRACAGNRGAEECKYIFENGDTCTLYRATGRHLCKYEGGK